MAIVFSKTLDQTVLLRSFIDNEVTFSSDSASAAIKCQITVDTLSGFEISPDKDGEFYFNFKQVFKKIILDFFQDSTQVDLDPGDLTSLVKDYSQIYKEVEIVLLVSLANGSVETSTLNVKLIQSTSNYQDRRKQEIQVSESFWILSQVADASNRTFREVYFEGYPFDLQIYKNTPGNVTIENQNNLSSVTLNLPYKINRIFLSDGEKDVVTEGILTMARGINELEFNTSELTTVFIDKRESKCGKYLKWKNPEGGWSYWLFEELPEEVRDIKDLGYIGNQYGGLDNNDPIRNIGKQSSDTLRIGTLNVEPHYRRKLQSIVESPKVYLFMADQFSADDPTNWLSVRVNNRSFPVNLPKNQIFDLSFELEFPERANLTL